MQRILIIFGFWIFLQAAFVGYRFIRCNAGFRNLVKEQGHESGPKTKEDLGFLPSRRGLFPYCTAFCNVLSWRPIVPNGFSSFLDVFSAYPLSFVPFIK